MVLHPPYFLTTGISPCIEVWDLASGDLLKTITDNYFSSLTCNGRFLCAPESQRNSALRNVDHFNRNTYRSQVILMDIHGKSLKLWPMFKLLHYRNYISDICDLELASGFEWKKSFLLEKPGFGLATVNRTSLITCIDKLITCRKYTK